MNLATLFQRVKLIFSATLKQHLNIRRITKNGVTSEQLISVFASMINGHKISSKLNEFETPLANYCCDTDRPFSNWVKRNVNHPLTSKEILICYLIRQGKRPEEIQEILAISYDDYRQNKTRIARKTGIKLNKRGGVLEQFLRSLD